MRADLAPFFEDADADFAPFGGGAGMLMRAQPLFESVEEADPPRPLYLLGPGGRRFDQATARELASAFAALWVKSAVAARSKWMVRVYHALVKSKSGYLVSVWLGNFESQWASCCHCS